MMTGLSSEINNLAAFSRIAIPAKRLEVVREVGATHAKGDDVIHRLLLLLATCGAAAVGRISVQDVHPFFGAALALRVSLPGEIAMAGNAIGFGVAFPIGSDYCIPSLTVILAPLGRLLVQTLTVLERPFPLFLANVIGVILTITFVALSFPIRILTYVLSLIRRAADATAGLLSIRITFVGGEFVDWLGDLALGASLVDNRHRSISVLDWAVPRLLQQRVAFSCQLFYPKGCG